MSKYVQYGCGLSAPKEWTNFDVSPTLRIQKMPIIGSIVKSQLNVIFPDNVLYGDVIKGLPIEDNSCDGVYCSHTLEHLALDDFRIALRNTLKILKPNGIFRCIVPDLAYSAKLYVEGLNKSDGNASMVFMNETMLGTDTRLRGMKGFINNFLGNSNHLWMWDEFSLARELKEAGFKNIRSCQFNDSEDVMFKHVEDADRFEKAVAMECRK
jgi:predicted SAM-dependent methyltransferase